MMVEPRFKAERVRSEAHKDYVRRMPCCVRICRFTPCEAHHFRTAATSGTAVKPGDDVCVPLCFEHHADFHQRGWKTFEALHGIDLREVAKGVAIVSRAMGILPK